MIYICCCFGKIICNFHGKEDKKTTRRKSFFSSRTEKKHTKINNSIMCRYILCCVYAPSHWDREKIEKLFIFPSIYMLYTAFCNWCVGVLTYMIPFIINNALLYFSVLFFNNTQKISYSLFMFRVFWREIGGKMPWDIKEFWIAF